LFLIALLSLNLTLFSGVEAQHKVLVEKFSNPNCNPCRIFDKKFDTLRVKYADRIDVIEYTTSFPAPIGYFKLNVSDNTDRQRYYNLGAVPMLCINGAITGTPDFTEELINKEYQHNPKWIADIEAIVTTDSVFIQGPVEYKNVKQDSLTVRIVITGSKNKNQMQQFVGKHTGFPMVNGKVEIKISEALKNNTVFRSGDAEVVIMVQDELSKQVLAHNVIKPIIK
jgi:hypothetical protein